MSNNIRRARTCDVAFTYRMPAGIPGAINRSATATVESAVLDTTNYPTAYGLAGTIDATSHNFRHATTGDTASTNFSLYVRPYPTGPNVNDPLGTSTPPTSGVANTLKRGYMTVNVAYGTPVKGGTVYVRITANGGRTTLGAIEAQSDTTYSVALPSNSYFTGPADSNGNVEVAFNI